MQKIKQTNKQTKKKEKKAVGLCKMLSSIINLPVVFIDLLADKARLVPATSIKCDDARQSKSLVVIVMNKTF